MGISATKEYLTRKELCAYLKDKGLGLCRATIDRMAVRGDGPPFMRLTEGGASYYKIRDVDAWIADRASARTSRTREPAYG